MKPDLARGALLGLAVGDALGTTYEFERIEQPPYPVLATGPAVDVVGGGPFDLAPGQVTDDTQLAVCLAHSLRERRRLDVVDLGERYVAWTTSAFDIGNQTGSALARLERGESAASAGVSTWRASGRRAAGNGSLMRTAPIAIALLAEPAQVIEAAVDDSLITHADPRCVLACAAFDAAIAAMVAGDPRPMVEVSRAAVASAERILTARWRGDDPDHGADRAAIAGARADLERDLDAALTGDPDVYGAELHLHRTAGFVRVAFRLAFWHAVHTPSWQAAIIDVASRGGDADTNAAIVGALLGARDGARAIPAPWADRVLGAIQPGPSDWAEVHHPRHLLRLLEAT
ncbi:MAG TPA: ADP-ribosylglycohydrolase family protein [Kofleriaceae bacterium]|jgi:ADP-ribosylglycohydrolase|nr:ADP-ribosylglycohydrolase family protein [Kofleriaceae bacterium]